MWDGERDGVERAKGVEVWFVVWSVVDMMSI